MAENISIRKVKNTDVEEVFNLSNQDYVRKYSINKDKIKWEEHVCWFNNVLQDINSVFYVVTDISERFLGQIRYNIKNDEATVSISLSRSISGKGLARHLLTESIASLFNERKEITEIIAYVAENNMVSIKLFENAGFSLYENRNGLMKYIYSREE